MADGSTAITDLEGLDRLLEFLKTNRGFDFTGYKRSSLDRRITKRMEAVGCAGYAEYEDYLEVHPDEFAELFDMILINVTSFFRDATAWRHLQDEVLPEVLRHKEDGSPIRVWCAGCASGEEAYSVAIVLAEILGNEAFRERVKIYGTDVDEDALATARQGTYDQKALAGIEPEVLDRYFDASTTRRVFRPDLRRAVIFGRNDLVQDAPISRVDVLVCRNTLMYFTAETQANILRRFNFALADNGVMFLGKSEMLISRGRLFTPVDLKQRMFRKAALVQPRLHFQPSPPSVDGPGHGDGDGDGAGPGLDGSSPSQALDASPIATVVVDGSGAVTAVSAAARALFGLTRADVGRPLQDLEVSYRPLELRANIDRAYAERRPVAAGTVEWKRNGDGTDARTLDVSVAPLLTSDAVLGAAVTFSDITEHHKLEADLQRSRRELETAYAELQATVEELETTNEELQSTNEELETTNEELQSTNEELETMNEELQSTNEELETINDELRLRTGELNDANLFLEAILTSMGVGVVVLDAEQHVRIWNSRAEDLWGLRFDEVDGEHLFNLDIGLPLGDLRPSIRAVLAGDSARSEDIVEATTRRGRAIACTVTTLPVQADGKVSGAIVLMEDGQPAVVAD